MPREKGGFWIGVCAVVFYPITWLVARRRFVGGEHIPATGPAIVVGNHISYIDPIYTAVLVHRRGRIPRFMAKASLWSVPVLGRILRSTGQIPVYRDSTEAGSSLREAEKALAEGKVVLIYPEGTITRDPQQWPMLSRTGVARLALNTDAPVIPLVHWGTHEVYDHYRKRFRPSFRKWVVVRAAAALDLGELRDRPVDADALRTTTDRIMTEVRELLADVREQPAPEEFFVPARRRDDDGGKRAS